MNLEYYRKAAKRALVRLRTADPQARLADAQLATAREAGFPSWRALKAHIDGSPQAHDPASVKAFADALARDRGDIEAIRSLLDAHPQLAECRPWPGYSALEAAAHLCVWHRPKAHEIAKLLLARGAKADLPTLARAGLLDEVKRRLDADPSLLNQPDALGRTPLYRACCVYGFFKEAIGVGVALLDRGADLDVFSAASWMMTDRLPAMLAADRSLARAHDPEGLTPLHWVTRSDSNDPREVETARLLLDAGADPDARAADTDGMTPLHCAAEWPSSVALATLLIERGAAVNARTLKWGWTPLDYAIDRNRAAMRDFLRSVGGRTRQELDDQGRPEADAFLRAVHSGGTEVVREALKGNPSLVNAVAKHPVWGGRPQALHVAIERGDAAMSELLLSAGANVSGENALYDHWSPLMLAVHWKRDAMRDELLGRVSHVSLIDALMLGDDATALRIMSAGAIMLQRAMPNDATMLHFARTYDAAERLIELGVEVGAKDKYGQTALDRAAAGGHRDVVDLLIEHGATASPLTWVKLGNAEALRAALQGLAPTPDLLVAAVDGGHVELATWLLDQGLDVGTRQATGSKGTLLHLAAWRGDLRMADLLLDRGADATATDEEHRTTPLVWAEVSRQYTGNTGCDAVIARLAAL